jgi:hypothetical protein
VTGHPEGANTPENFQLRWACRCLMESSIGRRQSVFRMQQEPHGSCGSLRRSAGFRAGERPWGAEFEASWFAQTRRTQACEGTSGSESSCDRPGMMCFEGGSDALEPRPWNQNGRAQVPWRPRSFQTSYSSEFEAAKHRGQEGAAGAAMHHGLPVRKSVASENPMSGSGPSVSARLEGDQTVEGARNPEDGRRRTGRSGATIPPLMSLKGRETPGGATRPGMAGEGVSARTLRGR